MSTMLHDAMTETYTDVRGLICHTVHRFIERYGTQWGDFDDLMAQANWEFMVAYRDYDRPDSERRTTTSSFSTWCRWVVQKGLLEIQRNSIRRDRQCRVTFVDMVENNDQYEYQYTFQLCDFMDGLSADAQLVVDLALNPPKVIAACFAECRNGTPRQLRAVLRQYLLGLDWDGDRVNDVFDEIGDSL